MGQFQANTQLNTEEIKRILELETRLGVLSAINYTFPFTGQSRPVFPTDRRKLQSANKEAESNDDETVELGDEDFLPKSPALAQLDALKTLESESNESDQRRERDWRMNPLAKTTTSDLLDHSHLENVLVIHPLMRADVTIDIFPSPILFEALFDDLPEPKLSAVIAHSTTSMIKLNFVANTTTAAQIKPHLVNLCHFLQARGHWANAIDPATGCALYGTDAAKRREILAPLDDFEIIRTKSQTTVRPIRTDTTPGIILTNAPSNTTLIGDLRLLCALKRSLSHFYRSGVANGYLAENGTIIDQERAQAEKMAIFEEHLHFNTDPHFNLKRFMRLYQFMTG